MDKELAVADQKRFNDLRHVDDDGNEFWLARELQPALQYSQWRRFEETIERAKISCEISQHEIENHFADAGKLVDIGSGTKRKVKDYKLSRYACYLVVMNGDPRKKVIADGQTYFAVKTRQQELEELYNLLSEDDKRLFLRGDVKQKNMLLAEAAKNAGIITGIEYARFQDAGYIGLYGGLRAIDIAHKKHIDPKREDILDYMGSAELGANLFRITQTEEIMKRNHIDNPDDAIKTHGKVGREVREAIKRIGGTMPEELPTPDKSIKQIESARRKQIKNKR
jgi:DNA-damage-inducible protein D